MYKSRLILTTLPYLEWDDSWMKTPLVWVVACIISMKPITEECRILDGQNQTVAQVEVKGFAESNVVVP